MREKEPHDLPDYASDFSDDSDLPDFPDDSENSTPSPTPSEKARNDPHSMAVQTKFLNNEFRNLVAVDIGARYPIAFCKKSRFQPFQNDRETLAYLLSKGYHSAVGTNMITKKKSFKNTAI